MGPRLVAQQSQDPPLLVQIVTEVLCGIQLPG